MTTDPGVIPKIVIINDIFPFVKFYSHEDDIEKLAIP